MSQIGQKFVVSGIPIWSQSEEIAAEFEYSDWFSNDAETVPSVWIIPL